jgi:hypothetical protein
MKKRIDLLRGISDACHELQLRSPGLLHSAIAMEDDQVCLREIQPAKSPQDTRWVEILLWTLMKLCIGPGLRLPSVDLESKGFYRLEASHHMHLFHIRTDPSTKLDRTKTIAYVLIPLFRRLNKCLKTTWWFLMSYEADWVEISNALTENLHNMELVCGLLLDSASSADDSAEKEPEIATCAQSSDILSQGETVTLQIASLLGDNSDKT